jgi:predicted HTH domain antitoxin
MKKNGKNYVEQNNRITGQRLMVRTGRNLFAEPVDELEFVKAWQSSISVLEAASKIDMWVSQAATFAQELRKRGVKLRRMTAIRHRLDVAALNRIARTIEANGNARNLSHTH